MRQMSIFDVVPEPTKAAPPPAPAPIEPVVPPAPVAPAAMTEHCELELVLIFDNGKGELLVSKNGREAEAVWLQCADVEWAHAGRNAPATTTRGKSIDGGLPVIAVNLSESLAREKGLL